MAVEVPGEMCYHCHRGFGLYQSAEAADILTVKCPMCGETGTYQKNEIQILVERRRQ